MVSIRILSSNYYCQHMRSVFGYSIVVCYQLVADLSSLGADPCRQVLVWVPDPLSCVEGLAPRLKPACKSQLRQTT